MMEALQVDGVVVVKRLDGLGRTLKGLIELLDGFQSENVKFLSVLMTM